MKKESINGRIIVQISIIWIFIIAIIATLVIAFFRNSIFATNISKEENTSSVEPNENSVDILQLMVQNNYSNKKLVDEQRKIDFNKQEIQDDQVPKGEKVVKQKGKQGEKQVKALQQFENDVFIRKNRT